MEYQPNTMRVLEKRIKLTRRGFLKGASLSIPALSAGALLAAPAEVMAQSFTALGSDTGLVLLKMARDIFPHDRVADKFYLHAIAPYDTDAAKDPALKALLLDGVAQLNAAARRLHGKDYLAVPDEERRVEVLRAIEDSAFFQKIKGGLVTGLYDNKELFPLFGYEGSSWEKGGYANRGFNDIDWI